MNEISGNTCPACEYKLGKPGKPVTRGGETHCLDCGNSWKQYGDATSRSAATEKRSGPLFSRPANPMHDAEPVAMEKPHDPIIYPDVEVSQTSAIHSSSFALPAILVVMVLLISGVVGTLYSIEYMSTESGDKGLHVERVAFEEIIRPNGDKVVKVEGMLGNDGNRTVPVRRIAIVLRKANGQELARWYHSSKVPTLRPGKKTGFVTAMAINAPVIATVDAILE